MSAKQKAVLQTKQNRTSEYSVKGEGLPKGVKQDEISGMEREISFATTPQRSPTAKFPEPECERERPDDSFTRLGALVKYSG